MDNQLRDVVSAVSANEDFTSMARTMLSLIGRIAPLDAAYLTRVERANGLQRVLFAYNRSEEIVTQGEAFEWQASVCARAMADGTTYIADVAATWPDSAVAERPIKTYVMAPIYDEEGGLFGTLCGVSREPDACPDDPIPALLDVFARLLSHQTKRDRSGLSGESAADQQEPAAEMTFLQEIGQLCLKATEVRYAVIELARLINTRGTWRRAIPFYRDPAGNIQPGWEADTGVAHHLDAIFPNPDAFHRENAGRTSDQLLVLDETQTPVGELRRAAGFDQSGGTAIINVAADQDSIHGGVILFAEQAAPINDRELKVLNNCSNYLALLAARLQNLGGWFTADEGQGRTASHDVLTGLRNRQHLVGELGRMLAQAERLGETLHVVSIDLDGLRQINDRHGREAGDQFLAAMAQRLIEVTRDSDVVARYGDDELVVVGPSTGQGHPEHDRARLAGRVSEAMSGWFALPGFSIDYGGPSVGAITVEPGQTDPEAILSQAQSAMAGIKAKRREQGLTHG